MNSKFYDRHKAGQMLASRLAHNSLPQGGLVLALPRGGVPIGWEVARKLGWQLDIWLVRKLGVPDQPELAMGAIALPNAQIVNYSLMEKLQITEEQLASVIDAETLELHRRDQLYRQGLPLPEVASQSIILVDDGLATGATMQAAIAALRHYQPASLTVAVPVASPSSLQQIQTLVDEVVYLAAPEWMGSISQWYTHFEAVSDEEVIELLKPYLE